MRGRTIELNAVVVGFGIAALIAGLTASPPSGWAKHKSKTPKHSVSDPCAGPSTFVKDHVTKIRALQDSTKSRKSTVIGMFSWNSSGDPNLSAKIAELRRDADRVNDMLRVGGCSPIDIDAELKAAPATQSSAAQPSKRKKH